MCGHAVIGAVTSLLETGALAMTEPVTTIVIDTAAGLVRAEAWVEAGQVTQVIMENAPAFVYRQLVDARQLALDLVPKQAGHLAALGM